MKERGEREREEGEGRGGVKERGEREREEGEGRGGEGRGEGERDGKPCFVPIIDCVDCAATPVDQHSGIQPLATLLRAGFSPVGICSRWRWH